MTSSYCYKDINETIEWKAARSFCLLHNGDLATFHSYKEKELIAHKFNDYWLGYKYRKGMMMYLETIIKIK